MFASALFWNEVILVMKRLDKELLIRDQQRGFVYRSKQSHRICDSPVFMCIP
jgi:hypothetical protein